MEISKKMFFKLEPFCNKITFFPFDLLKGKGYLEENPQNEAVQKKITPKFRTIYEMFKDPSKYVQISDDRLNKLRK
jgi:hypothetical protein